MDAHRRFEPESTQGMKPVNDLIERLAQIQQKAQRQAERAPAIAIQPTRNVVKLPFWPEPTRGVPNGVLRSALFGAIKKGARALLERQEIHAQNGISIVYSGARLDQGDLDVWETVLHIARVQALGDECRVTAYQLLKTLGKTDTGINRTTLNLRLSRMKATAVDVKVGKFSYEGSLIDEVYRAEESREYVIRLNPKLSALFAADQFTQVDWIVRHSLAGQPLAQWLHGYYASHAKPYPLNMATLLELSGSENTEPRSSRQKLRKALDAVSEACTVHGQRFSYEIKGDLVHVAKRGSEPQRRHLAKKAAKKVARPLRHVS